MAQVLTDENFESEIKEGITLVDFYADWCGPCKMIAPVIDELSNEVDDAKVAKMDVDSSPQTAGKFGIRSIPTLMVFKDGVLFDKIVGSTNKAGLEQLINSAR